MIARNAEKSETPFFWLALLADRPARYAKLFLLFTAQHAC
jgi:hypothetical protein